MLMDLFTKSSETGLLKEIYTDLAQPGVKKVGAALETVLDLSNTILLPLKIANEKSKILFAKNMERYKEKVECIDTEKISIVPPELGIPILDRLTYTSNETISEMFICLLAAASSTDTCNMAHPSFIQIISSLSVDEAKIINFLSSAKLSTIPFIYFKADRSDFPHLYKQSDGYLTGIEKSIDLLYPEKVDFYLDNLMSLGLFKFHQGIHLTNDGDSIKQLKEMYKDDRALFESDIDLSGEEFSETETRAGCYEVSTTGEEFISVCNP